MGRGTVAVSRKAAFWDTSAIVPLCTVQRVSGSALSLFNRYDLVVWCTTTVEIISALTRLLRLSQTSAIEFKQAKHQAEMLAADWRVIGLSQRILKNACQLLEQNPLRAADAMQLAAALEACEHAPQEYVFITADQRLAEAARKTGFAVEFL
jgi:predicted nucleic acid-binding protein